jgi:hypothetical protein
LLLLLRKSLEAGGPGAVRSDEFLVHFELLSVSWTPIQPPTRMGHPQSQKPHVRNRHLGHPATAERKRKSGYLLIA